MAGDLATRRPVAADWVALGCPVRLVVSAPGDLLTARGILVRELAAIDLACSRFRPDSELSRLDAANGRPVPITPLLAEAVGAALDAAAATDGDVDPTVGSAMAANGYDRDFMQVESVAGPIAIVRRPAPGWRQVELDGERQTLRVPAGTRLDLGATAKALAADGAARRIADAIDGRGVLVSLGGDVAVGGQPPTGGWSIRVQAVTGPVGAAPVGPSQIVAIRTGGLATSSTAARRWVRGGQVLHHILDPRSGVPVDSPWRTVSVAGPTCLTANVASTSAIVRGRSAVASLTQRGLAARFVDVDGDVVMTPGWPR